MICPKIHLTSPRISISTMKQKWIILDEKVVRIIFLIIDKCMKYFSHHRKWEFSESIWKKLLYITPWSFSFVVQSHHCRIYLIQMKYHTIFEIFRSHTFIHSQRKVIIIYTSIFEHCPIFYAILLFFWYFIWGEVRVFPPLLEIMKKPFSRDTNTCTCISINLHKLCWWCFISP